MLRIDSMRLAARAFRLAVGAVLIAGLSATLACGTKVAPPPTAPQVAGYIVGPPDELLIHILPEPEIEREVRVRPDGMISVDLVGDVVASGRTPLEIAEDIQTQIGRFKRDAVVSVSVTSSPSQFVTIYGEVARPGVFPLDAETRVTEAIGRVGGTRPFANLDEVRVIRTTGTNTEVLAIDLDAISDGDLSTNIVVRKGDLIVVPPTALAKVGYAIQQLLFPFQPFLSGAAQVGAAYSGVNGISGGN